MTAAARRSGVCDRRELRAGQRIIVSGRRVDRNCRRAAWRNIFGAHVTACATRRISSSFAHSAPDEVIDYTAEDFTRKVRRTTSSSTPSASTRSGAARRFAEARRLLHRDGRIPQSAAGHSGRWKLGDRQLKIAIARYSEGGRRQLKELVDAGEYRPVIDRTYPLDEVVEASRYVETQQKTGNVVLSVAHE